MEISIVFYVVFCALFFVCLIPNKQIWLRNICMIGQIIGLGGLVLFWKDFPEGTLAVEPLGAYTDWQGRFYLCLIWLCGTVALLASSRIMKK